MPFSCGLLVPKQPNGTPVAVHLGGGWDIWKHGADRQVHHLGSSEILRSTADPVVGNREPAREGESAGGPPRKEIGNRQHELERATTSQLKRVAPVTA